MNLDEDDYVVPFTLKQRRRIDRTERAVSGYTDEGGVFVPGLLQNTSDAIAVIKRIKTLAYVLCSLALFNALHLYGLIDMAKTILLGKP